MMIFRPHPRALLSGVLLALLAACAAPPQVKEETPEQPRTLVPSQELARIAALEAQGNFSAAAALYERLATTTPPPQRDALLLRAADNLTRARQFPEASNMLARVQQQNLSADQALLARLVGEEILLGQGRLEQALELLRHPPAQDAPTALRQRYLRDRADYYRLSGNPLQSAGELGELDLMLTDPQQRLDNQMQLLRTLSAMTDASLELLRPSPPGILGGWMDLARALKAYEADPAAAAARLDAWRDEHPSHPAMPELIRRYLAALGDELGDLRQIAVLLPLSGRYAAAGAAIRDGLLAAHYARPAGRRPELRFYDTSDPTRVWPLLQQAVSDGAGAVIGPLQKEAVEQLVRAGELDIRVLALNQVALDTRPPQQLFLFSLAPEDEARQAAERAWLDGTATALTLTPQDDWGERLYQAFRQRWEALGGQLAGHETYDPAKNDYKEPIQRLLLLDQSEERRRQLERVLGQRVEFEPRRRQDAGALFLAANQDNARELWPQLQFHHAGDLPVYTTSNIYSGQFDNRRDMDLVGLTFSDIPWLLAPDPADPLARERLPEPLSGQQGILARLFAMGMDSYRLLFRLGRLQEFPAITMAGATGRLYLDSLNRVHRQLAWARMTAQGPEILAAEPRLDSAGMHHVPGAMQTPASGPDAGAR